jgi:tRNA(Ile)-lysidine synthase
MHRLEHYINSVFEFLKGRTVFVAVSGGIDSITLLHIANKLFSNVQAVHINYGLRGEDSDSDEAHIRSYCEKNDIPFHVKRVQIERGNVQSEARTARYAYFNKLLKKTTNSALFLGHNSNDQVETFYQNLARKSGIMGLSCMLEKNDPYFRPLLTFSRKDIEKYADSEEISWREDKTNSESKYERNKLRNLILPKLYEELPQLKESVLIMIDHFQKLRTEQEISLAPVLTKIKTLHEIHFSVWDELSEMDKLALFTMLGFDHSTLEGVQKLDQKGKRVELGKNRYNYHAIIRDTDHFDLYKKGEITLPKLKFEMIEELPPEFNKDVFFVDPTKVEGDINLRLWEIGDRIKPIGMNGSQLVSDILCDAKYDQSQKDRTFVITDDKDILWIPGLKVGRKAIANKSTQPPILRLSLT